MSRQPKTTNPFVVYVTYPNSLKEYAYLCNIPGIRQDDEVLGNNDCKVRIVRTAASDPMAKYYVRPLPNQDEIRRDVRRVAVIKRLRELQTEQTQLELWQKLARKNTEAKKLLLELKGLI